MSKYIIELDYDLQRVVGVGVKQGTVWVKDYDVDDLEELCADYINEHYGQLQDEAYKRGLEEGKKATWELVADASNAEYQKGLNDAWECARKIADMWTRIDNDELLAIFGITERIGHSAIKSLFGKQTANEAMLELEVYEEKQKADDQIKVRDEVVWKQDGNVVMVVTRVYMVEGFEWCDGICKDGKVYSILTMNARKTGRQFDIDKILGEMHE